MHKQIIVNGFLLPDQLYVNEPPGIRAFALEILASNLNSLFGDKLNETVATIMKVERISRIEAIPKAMYYFEQTRSIYANASEEIMKPLRITLSKAMEEEKAGNINKAVQLFEELSDNAFIPSLPYDRLRVIYTKQKNYEEAIRICRRYIDILEAIRQFHPTFSNIESIPKYQEQINKLALKIAKE